jgi:hypothetical protein
VIAAIDNFCRKKGYTLAKVHVISDTEQKLSLFVDEGRLAKIVVHERNNYYAIRYRQTIDIPGRVYNTAVIQKNIKRLKRKYGLAAVTARIEKIPDYDKSVIQIDRGLERLLIFERELRIFSRYPAEYEIHFYFDYGEGKSGPGIRREGWGFNIDYDYPSLLIPVVSIYNRDLFRPGDRLETDFSAGFDAGLGGVLRLPPRNTLRFPPRRTFSMIESEYRFAPIADTIVTPVIRGRLYHSASGRPDLGYSSFEYVSLRETLAPGITPLENLNIYAGAGCESDRFYNVERDPLMAPEEQIVEAWEVYPFIEIRIVFDPLPFRPGASQEKNVTLTYTHYFDDADFNEIEIHGARDFEFSDLSVFSSGFRAAFNSSSAPFYHHVPVNSRFFRGFTGLSYHANRLAGFSTEYRFSLYRDYIYTGFFADWVLFSPEGIVLSGIKGGVVAGPTVRFLIFDQFDFTIYAGWDRLFPEGTGQSNLKFRFARRW